MLQQNINYVCVPLLCCLVKWCVTILQKEKIFYGNYKNLIKVTLFFSG